jgi:hypothetical protein
VVTTIQPEPDGGWIVDVTPHDVRVRYCKQSWSLAAAWNHVNEILISASSRGPWQVCHSATHWGWRAGRGVSS